MYADIELRHADLKRGGRSILKDINWRVRPGERWILAGANGSGKTQLLKLLAGDVWPTPTARVRRIDRWEGSKEDIAYVGPERQDKYERYGWDHTVEKVIGTGLHRTDIPLEPLSGADRKHIASLLKRFAIENLATRRFLSLSYGERRVVLLARALAAKPGLLLMDELLNGLDVHRGASARRFLAMSARGLLPWVLSVHRQDDIPPSATHALILERGHIAYRGVLRRAPLALHLATKDRHGLKHSARRPRRRRASQPARPPVVSLRQASVYLADRARLRNITLDLRGGECWVVHGSNGSGKSTFLRTVYGDHGVASGGSIEREGIDSGVPLDAFKRTAGFIAPHLQADHLLATKVIEVVISGLHASIGLNEVPTAAEIEAAKRSLRFFGLSALASRSLREVSYGQFRRVLFARAWIGEPRLLLLDEPYTGLDAHTRKMIDARLEAIHCKGACIVIATHQRDEWPVFATHELELSGGLAVYSGALRRHSS